jgi:DNA polymerase III delta prime subunit
LHGRYGTGKTQLAKFLPSIMEQQRVEQFDDETFNQIGVSFWSCSASGGSETAKMAMPTSRSFNQSGMHYIILDEVDNLRADAQRNMKSFITEYSHVVYIMTTNRLSKIDEGLRSRSYCISFENPDVKKWIDKCRTILLSNGVSYDGTFVENLVKNSKGDARNILSNIERYILLEKEK